MCNDLQTRIYPCQVRLEALSSSRKRVSRQAESVVLEQVKHHEYGRVFAHQVTDPRSRCAKALLQAAELRRAAFVANDNLAVEKRANRQPRGGAQDFGEPGAEFSEVAAEELG